MQFKLAILPSFLLNWIRYHFIISLYNLSANATAVVVIDDDDDDDVDLDNMANWSASFLITQVLLLSWSCNTNIIFVSNNKKELKLVCLFEGNDTKESIKQPYDSNNK